MSRPFFSPASRRDLLEILDYIAQDKPRAALRYVERLEEACSTLAANPGIGTARDDLLPHLRCLSVGSHVIFYLTTDEGIDVVRVVHGARDIGRLFE